MIYKLGTEKINGVTVPIYRIIITNADRVEEQLINSKREAAEANPDGDVTPENDDVINYGSQGNKQRLDFNQ